MHKERRGIIGGLDYSLHMLQDVKKQLMDLGSPKNDAMWAIGGLMIAIVAHTIKSIDKVFQDSIAENGSNAKDDLQKIRKEINEFFDKMIGLD